MLRNIIGEIFFRGLGNDTTITGYASGAFNGVSYGEADLLASSPSMGNGEKFWINANQDLHGEDTLTGYNRNPTAGHTGAVIRPHTILAVPIYVY